MAELGGFKILEEENEAPKFLGESLGGFEITKPITTKTEEDINNKKTGLVTSAVAGIGSGAVKSVEGVTTLGTTLIDLGLGTDLTKDVEDWFDNTKTFTKLEDLADDRWTGSVTEVLTQLGVPGGIALKAASKLVKAKNAGFFARKPTTTNALAVGLAEAAAHTNDLGTIGDVFGGPTESDSQTGYVGRREAFRRLKNRFKFGVESAIGFGVFDKVLLPSLRGLGGVIKGSDGSMFSFGKKGDLLHNPAKVSYIDDAGNPVSLEAAEGFAFNKSNIVRYIDKIFSYTRSRADRPEQMFKFERDMIGANRAAIEAARRLAQDLETAAGKILDKKFDERMGSKMIKERDKVMEMFHDYLTTSAKKDPDKLKGIVERINAAGFSDVVPILGSMRTKIDSLSQKIIANPLAQSADPGGTKFVDTVAANIGEYLTRSYKAGPKATREKYLKTLRRTDEGRQVIEKTKGYIATKIPQLGTAIKQGDDIVGFTPKDPSTAKVMDNYINTIVRAGDEQGVGDILVKNKVVDAEVFKQRRNLPKQIRELLGEETDVTEQYVKSIAKMEDFLNSSKYFQEVYNSGMNKYIFPKAASGDGVSFTTQIKTANPFNPLNGKYTTKEIAESLAKFSDDTIGGSALGTLYRTAFLGGKALTQEMKTTLSPITHFRNFVSALAFSAVNGNLFRPGNFAEARRTLLPNLKSQLAGDMKKRFNSAADYQAQFDEYQKLQRLGIVNTSARLGDITRTFDEVAEGIENTTELGKAQTLLGSMGEKLKIFDPIRKSARTLYQAEDDFYKIQNFYAERAKVQTIFKNAFENDNASFIARYGDEAKKLGIDDLNAPGAIDDFLDQYAADIVRNNIPNYDYVGSGVQFLRKLPFGNFVAFPAEIIRTGVNTITRGIKEYNDPLLRGIGIKRLGSMAVFGLGSGKAFSEIGQAITGVTNEQMNALREFIPKWSENSDLIPIKQDGELFYIDYSHTNAYDALTRPFRTALNEMKKGAVDEEGFMKNMTTAAIAGTAEVMKPFVEEAIFTSFVLDIFARGGASKEGFRIYNPEDPLGDKLRKVTLEALKTFAPGSANQFYRLGLSATGDFDKLNRQYKVINEFAGVLGFRIQNPYLEDALGKYKISEYKKRIENSKKILTRDLTRGTVTPDQAVEIYKKANRAKLDADKQMLRAIKAAEILGVSKKKINKALNIRLSKKEKSSLLRNKFTPYRVPDFLKKNLRDTGKLRGLPNYAKDILNSIQDSFRDLRGSTLFEDPNSIFKGKGTIGGSATRFMEGPFGFGDPAPLVTTNPLEKAPTPAPIVAPPSSLGGFNIISSDLGTGTISPSDRSQLAKSGDIDITEALVNRG